MRVSLILFSLLWITISFIAEAAKRLAKEVVTSKLNSVVKQSELRARKNFNAVLRHATQNPENIQSNKAVADTEIDDEQSPDDVAVGGKANEEAAGASEHQNGSAHHSSDEEEEEEEKEEGGKVLATGKGVTMNIYSGGSQLGQDQEGQRNEDVEDPTRVVGNVISHIEKEDDANSRRTADEKEVEKGRDEGEAELEINNVIGDIDKQAQQATNAGEKVENQIEVEDEKIELEKKEEDAEEHAEEMKADKEAEKHRGNIHYLEKDIKAEVQHIKDDELDAKEEKVKEELQLNEINDDEKSKLEEIKQLGAAAELEKNNPGYSTTAGDMVTLTVKPGSTSATATAISATPAPAISKCLEPCGAQKVDTSAPAPHEQPILKSSQISLPPKKVTNLVSSPGYNETFEHCQPLSFREATTRKHLHHQHHNHQQHHHHHHRHHHHHHQSYASRPTHRFKSKQDFTMKRNSGATDPVKIHEIKPVHFF